MGRLPDFEGSEVDRSLIRLTKAGDGLSEPMRLQPVALSYHDTIYLVVKAEVTQINHRPIGRDEPELLTRVHTVEARQVALVDEKDVADLLQHERLRIKRLQDEAAAREPLPGIDETPPFNVGGIVPTMEDVPAENIFGGTFDERGPVDDGQADGEKPARRPRKGSLAAGLELIASITDPSELFALMDEEERGKNRQAVMDAAAARIAELAAEQEAAEVRDLVADAEAGDASDYGAH